MSEANSATIASEVLWRVMDDNAVVVTPQTGKVRVLNPVGSIIWQLLADETPIADIEVYLTTHFEVSQAQAKEDIQQFIDELKTRGIVTVH